MNQIGERVSERRREMKLTQDAVCGRVAMATGGRWNPDWRDMVRIEGGTRLVSDLEMVVLAKALECDPVWLFLGKPPVTIPRQPIPPGSAPLDE